MPISKHKLRIPLIQAPMFLQSGPEMVIASCKGQVGFRSKAGDTAFWVHLPIQSH